MGLLSRIQEDGAPGPAPSETPDVNEKVMVGNLVWQSVYYVPGPRPALQATEDASKIAQHARPRIEGIDIHRSSTVLNTCSSTLP